MTLGIVIAGGQGQRLGRLTNGKPKSLLDVCGRPIIRWCLDRLWHAGLRRAIIVTRPDAVQETQERLSSTKIDYSVFVQRAPCGTMDALRCGLRHAFTAGDCGPVCVVFGDNIPPTTAFTNILAARDCDATFILRRVANPGTSSCYLRNDAGLIVGLGRGERFRQPGYFTSTPFYEISPGLYYYSRNITRKILDAKKPAFCDEWRLEDSNAVFLRTAKVQIVECKEPWIHINTEADLKLARRVCATSGAESW